MAAKKKPESSKLKKITGSKWTLPLFGVVILALSFGGGLALSETNKTSQKKGPIQTKCDGLCVAIYDGYADPDTVAVTAGSFVQFNTADGKKHNLTLGGDSHHDASEISSDASGDFGADEAWRVQFKKDGTYLFKDKYNEKLNIRVVVYTEGKDYKITR